MDTYRPIWRSRAWLVAVMVFFLLALTLTTAGGAGHAGSAAGWAPAALAAGAMLSVFAWAHVRTRAQRKRYDDDLAAWSAERAAQSERLRIAADLHDLVSHGLGLITVRAAAARSVPGTDGETERQDALADIERTSRETTTELRRMLSVLRTPGAVPVRPADTLDDLPSIVDAANVAGLTATLHLGDVGDVSPGVQLTVCAVVREALNNVIRHAGPTSVRIDVDRDGETIVVDGHDGGPQRGRQPQPGAGHGLAGVRGALLPSEAPCTPGQMERASA